MRETLLNDSIFRTCYGSFFEASPAADFSVEDVPENLRALVPYARFWGVSDDGVRSDLLYSAHPEITANLKSVFQQYDDRLDDWLRVVPDDTTDAYIAFSAMQMAALMM